jgi:hypothetical protein
VGFVCEVMFESNQSNKTPADGEANPLVIIWFTYVLVSQFENFL